jgi:hypothetical protein
VAVFPAGNSFTFTRFVGKILESYVITAHQSKRKRKTDGATSLEPPAVVLTRFVFGLSFFSAGRFLL